VSEKAISQHFHHIRVMKALQARPGA
jgi:hypothetical protein